jgi:hypothetical protein
MTEIRSDRLLDVVDRASRGDHGAKQALLIVLETDRQSIIFKKLRLRGVRRDDLADAHHDVSLKVFRKIEQLQVSEAYFRWEDRIVSEISRNVRESYRELGEAYAESNTTAKHSSLSQRVFA